MHRLILLLGAISLASPAYADLIAPRDAAAHVGQLVTVEGVASVYTPANRKVTFVDLGGSGRSAPFSGVIFASDFAVFPAIASYGGKKVDLTGTVQMYQGKPEIILKNADQLKLAE